MFGIDLTNLQKRVFPYVSGGIGSLPNIGLPRMGEGSIKAPTVSIPQIPAPAPFVPPAAVPPSPLPNAMPARDVRGGEDLTRFGSPNNGIINPETGRLNSPISAPFTGGARVPQIQVDPETGRPLRPIVAPFTGGARVPQVQVDPETGRPDRPITTDPRDMWQNPDFSTGSPPFAPGGGYTPPPPPAGPGADNVFFAEDPDKYTGIGTEDEGTTEPPPPQPQPQPYVPTDVSVATNYALANPVPIPVRRENPFDRNSPIIPPANQGVGSLFVRGG